MDRNTLSEGLLIRYDVRNGRYRAGNYRNNGLAYAMGTYTPRILRGTEFYIGPPVTPQGVEMSEVMERNNYSRPGHQGTDRRSEVRLVSDGVVDIQQTTASGETTQEQMDSSFEGTEFFRCLTPLFYTMAVFGLFYPSSRGSFKYGHHVIKLYGVLVILLLWSNVVRLLSCFSADDEKRPGLVIKLSILGWFACSGVSSLVCFWAWHSNSFPVFFEELQKFRKSMPQDFKYPKELKASTLFYSLLAYVLLLCATGFGLYAIFGTEKLFKIYDVDTIVCPAKTTGSNSGLIVLYVFALIYSAAAWILPLTQVHVLCMISRHEYQKFGQSLNSGINTDPNIHRKFEEYRERHLVLDNLISHLDRILLVYSSFVFVVNFLTFVSLIGDLSLNYSNGNHQRVTSAVFLSISLLSLVVFLISGVLLSCSRKDSFSPIISYKVFSASSENCLQVGLFLYQVTEPRGLSILGLFTVNKHTALAVLSVIVVYLAILIHMVPGESNKLCHSTTNATGLN